MLYVGDLSYADDYPFHDNVRWDTWGRFTERVAAYQPWIWTAGNHELDFAPDLVSALYHDELNNLASFFGCFVRFDHIPSSFMVYFYAKARCKCNNLLILLFADDAG